MAFWDDHGEAFAPSIATLSTGEDHQRRMGTRPVLAAALAGNADYIVSEDLDLLSMGEYEGIAICDTRTMSDLLSADDNG